MEFSVQCFNTVATSFKSCGGRRINVFHREVIYFLIFLECAVNWLSWLIFSFSFVSICSAISAWATSAGFPTLVTLTTVGMLHAGLISAVVLIILFLLMVWWTWSITPDADAPTRLVLALAHYHLLSGVMLLAMSGYSNINYSVYPVYNFDSVIIETCMFCRHLYNFLFCGGMCEQITNSAEYEKLLKWWRQSELRRWFKK